MSWTPPNKGKTNVVSGKEAGGASKRPTMGTLASEFTNRSAQSGGTIARKKGNSSGGFLEAATAKHKANVQETLGFQGAPQCTLYKANAASANETQRNTYLVPSAVGNRDFYAARKAAGN